MISAAPRLHELRAVPRRQQPQDGLHLGRPHAVVVVVEVGVRLAHLLRHLLARVPLPGGGVGAWGPRHAARGSRRRFFPSLLSRLGLRR